MQTQNNNWRYCHKTESWIFGPDNRGAAIYRLMDKDGWTGFVMINGKCHFLRSHYSKKEIMDEAENYLKSRN